ncbi:MAG TPA: tetratricopeptide repeat protein, partial [Anaerolineales bacterium]|nr:tetratricopeptide repeat protein [Anaerolineales bacterium]
MKSSRKTITRIAAVLALSCTLLAGGLFLVTRNDSPAARLLRQGNQAFASDNFMDALGLYQLAQTRFPELAEPFYNAANALYRQESYPDAIAQIDQALQANADGRLAQHSFYNKGNAAYNSQDLEAAIQAYIEALLINPDDADAKYNLELALQQQQQQEQQQQEENQEQQDQ